MGLDMYLTGSRYISGWEHRREPEFDAVLKAAGLESSDVCQGSPSMNLGLTIAYWRKANAIHAWFVKNCQDDVDECQKTHVEREKLEELRDICVEIIDANTLNADWQGLAQKLLPPESGFFFGSTDLDENYLDDLKQTIEQLNRILANPRLKEMSFYYQSSW